jgi:sodium/hydrogen antiporter
LALVLVALFLWAVLSAKAQRAYLSAPIVFVAAGWLLAEGLDALHPGHEAVKLVAETTLVWVLFADASRVELGKFRSDAGLFARLLGVGLPLTVALGALAAVLLLDMEPWTALLVAAALAPTDAALGAAVMTNPAVPEHSRRLLNVESGLNDGIVTPVVLLAIAGVAADNGIAGIDGPGRAAVSLLVGSVVGAGVGVAGGLLTRGARRRGWLAEDFAGPGVLALALLTYATAVYVDANGFVAAFIGGLAFGATAGRGGPKEVEYVEQTAELAAAVSWLLFGAVAVSGLAEGLSWTIVGYAVLSLTVLRMLPVTLSLLGAGFDRATVAFVGWFGPRGLASVIFALLALEDLHGAAHEAVDVIALTVVLSVLAHGLTAVPLAVRYGRTEKALGPSPAPAGVSPSAHPSGEAGPGVGLR